MKKECANCKHSYKNNDSGHVDCPAVVGSCDDFNKFEPVTEICCANCKNHPGKHDLCEFNPDCFHTKSTRGRVGRHNHYYNHFVPKEDKTPWINADECINCHPNYYKPGKVVHVRNYNHGCCCSICGKLYEGLYSKNKEDKVEYKATGKALTARQVIAESMISATEANRMFRWLVIGGIAIDNNLFEASAFLPYALQHTCFRYFLLAGKYIEAVDTWVSPKRGDRFRIIGNEYILSSVAPNRYTLINILTGCRLDDAVDVQDAKSITKDEFYKLAGFRHGDELERI